MESSFPDEEAMKIAKLLTERLFKESNQERENQDRFIKLVKEYFNK